jgi:3-dehydroquinate dehydratase-2
VILRNRIDVLHGVNLDQLGKRDPAHYGSLTLDELNARVERDAAGLGLSVSFFQTNHEGELVERIHRARELADGIVLNAGAWTHYAWSLHDALELAGVPAVEVHLSDVMAREPWRHVSVVRDVCIATISGLGADGYRDALALLAAHLRTDEENA